MGMLYLFHRGDEKFDAVDEIEWLSWSNTLKILICQVIFRVSVGFQLQVIWERQSLNWRKNSKPPNS